VDEELVPHGFTSPRRWQPAVNGASAAFEIGIPSARLAGIVVIRED
jgi:hypothetical protein